MCNTFYNICVYVILTCLLFVFCCLDQLLLELRELLVLYKMKSVWDRILVVPPPRKTHSTQTITHAYRTHTQKQNTQFPEKIRKQTQTPTYSCDLLTPKRNQKHFSFCIIKTIQKAKIFRIQQNKNANISGMLKILTLAKLSPPPPNPKILTHTHIHSHRTLPNPKPNTNTNPIPFPLPFPIQSNLPLNQSLPV